jgi:hypothetical protein
MLWSENSGTLIDGLYVPTGLEVNADSGDQTNQDLFNQFLILSDNNRDAIEFKPLRIETRKRMANGRMRSYHIADKLTLSTSWNMLPSRSYALRPNYNQETGKSPYANSNTQEYTTDGGAGGVDILDWYENHKGSFWVFLAYDKYSVFGDNDAAYAHLNQYNQLVEMFISDFTYSVVKRGGSTYDFWNISVTLEEV